ncbi:hypothetical protein [Methylobacterium sp. A54F]
MAANDPHHFRGETVDDVDQTSSVLIAGIAIAGAAVSLLLIRLVIG